MRTYCYTDQHVQVLMQEYIDIFSTYHHVSVESESSFSNF